LTHKPLVVSAEALTPNTNKYVAVGLLKQSRLKTVSLVMEKSSGRPLVAHQLHFPASLAPEEARKRLETASASLAKLRHPRIPTFMGYQVTPTGHWLLFEYVEGFPLGAYESECQVVSDPWVLWWLLQILHMLAELHQAGIMIGGVVPRHFLVSQRDLYLVHLGLVENIHPLAFARASDALAFTAPECTGSVLSVAGDLYSAGAVAWWLAVGSNPLPPQGLHRDTVEAAVCSVRPNFPAAAIDVLTRLLQALPADRYSSADAAIEALAPHVPAFDPKSRPPEVPWQLRFFGDATIRRLDLQAEAVERKAARPAAPPATAGFAPKPATAPAVPSIPAYVPPPPKPAAPAPKPAPPPPRPSASPPRAAAPAARASRAVETPSRPVPPLTVRAENKPGLAHWTVGGLALALVLLLGGGVAIKLSQRPHGTVAVTPSTTPGGSQAPSQAPTAPSSAAPVDDNAPTDRVTLAGGSALSVRAGSNYRVVSNSVHMASGQMTVEAAGSEEVDLVIPYSQVQCQPGSRAEIHVDERGLSNIHCVEGEVHYVGPSGPAVLHEGQTATIGSAAP
ncbi:MAG TPA: protein kinase, partial [Candidatus Xenobia bacterium]